MEQSMTRTLLVDNSNTRTKFTLLENGRFDEHYACLPTAELTVVSIRALLAERGWQYEKVLICSVVPQAAPVIAEATGGDVHLLGSHSPMELELDYPQPHTLGADRLANAVAAAAFAPLPCVVLDFGTAATFDVLVAGQEKPRFIGGAIAPGLAALGQYLGRNTALLPALEPQKPAHAIGRSTQEAMQVGSCIGYCGLVRGIVKAMAEELVETPYVIATGGDAVLLKEWLPEMDCVRPRLTFEGLALVAQAAW